MDSTQNQTRISREEEEEKDILRLINLGSGMYLVMVLKAAVQLNLFDIITKYGQLSSDEIAARIPTQNHQAPAMIDRMMRFLATNSFINCSTSGGKIGAANVKYSLAPICRYLLGNQDGGASFGSILSMLGDKVILDSWCLLKDAILEGGVPFDKAHGMHIFDYASKDERFSKLMNNGMSSYSHITVKRMLEVYNGFESVKEIVDVGGGVGTTLNMIVSRYPNIRGINFDLPPVVKDAPSYPGVEHVGGDMFESVPEGEIIFMKWVLHDWNDEDCLKLLENCRKSLRDTGKVILMDALLPEYPGTDILSNIVFDFDIGIMAISPGGKERTKGEIEILAKSAGFSTVKVVTRVFVTWIIELYKD